MLETRAYTDADGQKYGESSLLTMGKDVVYQLRNGKKEAILMKYDLNANSWQELLRTPYHLNNMELKDSMLYVPCEYGYWVVNTNTGETSHFDSLLLETGQTMATDVNVMAFDRQGGLWLGTENTVR